MFEKQIIEYMNIQDNFSSITDNILIEFQRSFRYRWNKYHRTHDRFKSNSTDWLSTVIFDKNDLSVKKG